MPAGTAACWVRGAVHVTAAQPSSRRTYASMRKRGQGRLFLPKHPSTEAYLRPL